MQRHHEQQAPLLRACGWLSLLRMFWNMAPNAPMQLEHNQLGMACPCMVPTVTTGRWHMPGHHPKLLHMHHYRQERTHQGQMAVFLAIECECEDPVHTVQSMSPSPANYQVCSPAAVANTVFALPGYGSSIA